MRRTRRARLALFSPRRHADRAGAGDRLIGLERDLRHAPRRSRRRCSPRRCRPASVHTGHRCSRLRAGRRRARVTFANGAVGRGRHRDRGRRHPFRAAALRVSAVAAGVPRLRRLPRPGAARAHSALAGRALADVARHGKAFSRLPGARRADDQLCRLRAGRRGDEGILVGARRSRRAAPRVRRLGSAHRGAAARNVQTTFRWALVRPRAAADLDQRAADACSAMPRIRCCRISARAPTSRSRTAWRSRQSWRAPTATTAPAALLAYERLRRERVAQVQRGARENGMRYDSAYSDLGVRDAEIAAHAAFRRRLYDHDVVPDAQAAAAGAAVTAIAASVSAHTVLAAIARISEASSRRHPRAIASARMANSCQGAPSSGAASRSQSAVPQNSSAHLVAPCFNERLQHEFGLLRGIAPPPRADLARYLLIVLEPGVRKLRRPLIAVSQKLGDGRRLPPCGWYRAQQRCKSLAPVEAARLPAGSPKQFRGLQQARRWKLTGIESRPEFDDRRSDRDTREKPSAG